MFFLHVFSRINDSPCSTFYSRCEEFAFLFSRLFVVRLLFLVWLMNMHLRFGSQCALFLFTIFIRKYACSIVYLSSSHSVSPPILRNQSWWMSCNPVGWMEERTREHRVISWNNMYKTNKLNATDRYAHYAYDKLCCLHFGTATCTVLQSAVNLPSNMYLHNKWACLCAIHPHIHNTTNQHIASYADVVGDVRQQLRTVMQNGWCCKRHSFNNRHNHRHHSTRPLHSDARL